MALHALAMAMGNPFPTFKEQPITQAELKQYEGVYQLGEKDTLNIRAVDGKLQSQRNGGDSFELKSAGNHHFVFAFDSLSRVTFHVQDSHVISISRLMNGGGEEKAVKTNKPLPKADKGFGWVCGTRS